MSYIILTDNRHKKKRQLTLHKSRILEYKRVVIDNVKKDSEKLPHQRLDNGKDIIGNKVKKYKNGIDLFAVNNIVFTSSIKAIQAKSDLHLIKVPEFKLLDKSFYSSSKIDDSTHELNMNLESSEDDSDENYLAIHKALESAEAQTNV